MNLNFNSPSAVHPPRTSIGVSGLAHAAYKLILGATDIYAISIIVYFVARWVLGNDDWWYINLMSNFIQWVLLPGFIFLPIAIWRRNVARVGLWIPSVVMFVALYGVMFLPGRTAAAPEDAITLRAMTYNVAVNNARPEDLITAMRESDADIIGFEEFGLELQAALNNALLEEYPYRVMVGEFVGGKGLFSRYPIEDYEIHETEIPNRPDLEAHINIDGQLVTVFVVHPQRPGFRFEEHLFGDSPLALPMIKAIIERINPEEPTILMGDFNLTDQNDHYDLLTSIGLIDSFREVGSGFGATFPAHFTPIPLVRIDYIWSTEHFLPLHSHRGMDAGSDHLPVITEFAWVGE